MANCGNCNQRLNCTCYFISSDNANLSGAGRIGAAYNFRPSNVPLPRPYGHYFRNLSNFTLPASTDTVILFDSVGETPFAGGMVDPNTSAANNQGRLICPANGAGIYLTSGFASINQQNVVLFIRKNGTDFYGGQNSGASTGGFSISRSVNAMVEMVPGDYLELVARVGGTPASTIRFDFNTFFNAIPNFWAQWVWGT